MRTYIFDLKGNTTQRDVTRAEMVDMFAVNVRDLRPILIKKQVTTMFRRGQSIIVNIQDIKMVLDAEKALLFFEHENQESQVLNFFKKRITAGLNDTAFELFMIEQAFGYIFGKLKNQFNAIGKVAEKTMRKLSDRPTDEYLEQLLVLKKKIGKIENQMEHIQDVLQEALEEENIPELCLKSDPQDQDLEQVESVIESLYEQAEMLNENIDELNENLDDSQEILLLKIANKRNTIIKFDLIVSFVAAVFGFLAVVVGLYGMNLKNHMETDETAFYYVLGGLVLVLLLAIGAAWRYLSNNKIIWSRGESNRSPL